MSNIISFPKLNCVTFPKDSYFVDSLPDFYKQVDYSQPFQVNDVIRFQFNINNAIVNIATMKVELIKLSDGSISETFGVDYVWINSGYLNITVSTVVHSIIGDHYVKITLPFLTGGTTEYVYSEKIMVKSNWENTVLIEYTNSGIDHDFFFLDQNGATWPFYFRVEGGFKIEEYTPGSMSNVYADQPHSFTALSGECWDIFKLTLGNNKGVPNYIQQLVSRIIFLCDSLTINDKTYCRNENSTWEQSEKLIHWGKSVWKIDLVESPNDGIVEFEYNPVVIDGDIAVIEDDFTEADLSGGNLVITTIPVIAYPLFVVVHTVPVIGDEFTQLYGVISNSTQEFVVSLPDLVQGTYEYSFYYIDE